MELSTDRIVQILLALLAAGGLSLSGVSSNDASTCRDLLADERAACAGTLEQVAEGYSESMDVLRDLCRD